MYTHAKGSQNIVHVISEAQSLKIGRQIPCQLSGTTTEKQVYLVSIKCSRFE